MIRPLLVNVVLSSGAQLVGTYMLLSYSVFIFDRAGLGDQAQLWSTLVSGSNWLGAIAAAFLFDQFGRRPQIIFAHAAYTAAMIILTVSFALIDLHITFAILCILCMMVIVVAYALGVGAGSVLVVVEMHAIHLRGLAMSLGAFINWLCFFVMAMLFPSYSDLMQGYTFAPFAVYNVLMLLFCIFVVRETKGRNIDLVQIDKKIDENSSTESDEKNNNEDTDVQYAPLHNVPSMDSLGTLECKDSALHSDLNVSTDSVLKCDDVELGVKSGTVEYGEILQQDTLKHGEDV